MSLQCIQSHGYPDLILTPWILGRKDPADVYGPKGLSDMAQHVLSAWKVDIDNRLRGIDRLPVSGCAINAHEIDAGVFFRDHNIEARAFRVRHAGLDNAFGFRVATPDRTIVFSGDTAPTRSSWVRRSCSPIGVSSNVPWRVGSS